MTRNGAGRPRSKGSCPTAGLHCPAAAIPPRRYLSGNRLKAIPAQLVPASIRGRIRIAGLNSQAEGLRNCELDPNNGTVVCDRSCEFPSGNRQVVADAAGVEMIRCVPFAAVPRAALNASCAAALNRTLALIDGHGIV